MWILGVIFSFKKDLNIDDILFFLIVILPEEALSKNPYFKTCWIYNQAVPPFFIFDKRTAAAHSRIMCYP